MRYGITDLTLGSDRFVELQKAQYDEALAARESLFTVLSIEEEVQPTP
jgi:hypothetical protein